MKTKVIIWLCITAICAMEVFKDIYLTGTIHGNGLMFLLLPILVLIVPKYIYKETISMFQALKEKPDEEE